MHVNCLFGITSSRQSLMKRLSPPRLLLQRRKKKKHPRGLNDTDPPVEGGAEKRDACPHLQAQDGLLVCVGGGRQSQMIGGRLLASKEVGS